ncbi:hypothetical protein [Xanthovirga aplysinae]|uniref:hypothetical protein n=1 Tax=Xanthovirga aplysinae TaxID=2529853 RepID=UPI0012BD0A74|nr:hypothetical protein [Xanthovirga aplysinae]MTI31427.1 hypothetical protein [Xanthovirga aplysinae]
MKSFFRLCSVCILFLFFLSGSVMADDSGGGTGGDRPDPPATASLAKVSLETSQVTDTKEEEPSLMEELMEFLESIFK